VADVEYIHYMLKFVSCVSHNKSVDAEMRGLIRYALEINDPSLAELVGRADADETVDNLNIPQPEKRLKPSLR